MVRNSVSDAMKKPSEPNRKPPEDEYLSFEEVKKGKDYIDKKLGEIHVIDKITSNGKNIIFIRLKGHTYEYPKFFTAMKLKRKEA